MLRKPVFHFSPLNYFLNKQYELKLEPSALSEKLYWAEEIFSTPAVTISSQEKCGT